MKNRRQRGSSSEKRAAAYLSRRGVSILKRNVNYRVGEIDIVGIHQGTLVFFEVRSRASATYGAAADSVTFAKQRKIWRAAQVYLSRHGTECDEIRFDVIAITERSLRWIQDAFRLGGDRW